MGRRMLQCNPAGPSVTFRYFCVNDASRRSICAWVSPPWPPVSRTSLPIAPRTTGAQITWPSSSKAIGGASGGPSRSTFGGSGGQPVLNAPENSGSSKVGALWRIAQPVLKVFSALATARTICVTIVAADEAIDIEPVLDEDTSNALHDTRSHTLDITP